MEKTTLFNFRIPSILNIMFSNLCEIKGCTRSSVLNRLIDSWVEKELKNTKESLSFHEKLENRIPGYLNPFKSIFRSRSSAPHRWGSYSKDPITGEWTQK